MFMRAVDPGKTRNNRSQELKNRSTTAEPTHPDTIESCRKFTIYASWPSFGLLMNNSQVQSYN